MSLRRWSIRLIALTLGGLPAQAQVAAPRPPVMRAPVQAQPTMPRVVGMSMQEAQALLARSGVQVAGVTRAASPAAAPGTVLRQSPGAGTPLQPGATAQLVVAEAAAAQRMPRVTGMALAQAETVLGRAGIQVSGVSEAPSSTAAAGTVTRQTPAAGALIEPGVTARLVVAVAAPEPERRMPRVTGMALAQAQTVLGRAGIQVSGVSEAPSSTAAAGTVTRQTPAAGALVEPGGTAQLVVAAAAPEPERRMPRVIGMALAQAQTILGRAGIQVTGVSQAPSSTAAAGAVTRQTPAAGALVEPGATAQLVVAAAAPEPERRMPRVTGMALAQAQTVLGRAGVQVSGVGEAPSSTAAAGTVTRQTPAAGAPIEPGATAQLVVAAAAPEPPPAQQGVVAMPDVRGMTREEAGQALNGVRLRVGQVTEREAAGLGSAVLGQSIAPGEGVAVGTAIDLVVSRPPVIAGDAPAAEVVVPRVTGLALVEAIDALQRVSLTADARPDSGSWRVDSQSPAAGARVPPGSSVRLVLQVQATAPADTTVDLTEADSSTPLLAADTTPAGPVVGADTFDAAAAVADPAGPAADAPEAAPPPWIWPGALMVALLAAALAGWRLARRARSRRAAPTPIPDFVTRGSWEPGKTVVAVPGPLVGGPTLRLRTIAVPYVSRVSVDGPLRAKPGD